MKINSKKMIELKKFDHKLKVMVNLEASEDSSQFLGIGGSDSALLSPDYTLETAHQKLVRLMHHSLDNLNAEISIQINEKAELKKFLENQKSMLAATPSIWPTRGWVSSRFGYRTSPFTNEKEFHRGLDISTRMKTPVNAPADGIVSSTGKYHDMGNMVGPEDSPRVRFWPHNRTPSPLRGSSERTPCESLPIYPQLAFRFLSSLF
jgi:hypothetical protein